DVVCRHRWRGGFSSSPSATADRSHSNRENDHPKARSTSDYSSSHGEKTLNRRCFPCKSLLLSSEAVGRFAYQALDPSDDHQQRRVPSGRAAFDWGQSAGYGVDLSLSQWRAVSRPPPPVQTSRPWDPSIPSFPPWPNRWSPPGPPIRLSKPPPPL